MNIIIKDPSRYFNVEQNQDYTFIFDGDSRSSIFIDNSLIKTCEENHNLCSIKILDFLYLVENTPDNGTYSDRDVANGIFIRIIGDFDKILRYL